MRKTAVNIAILFGMAILIMSIGGCTEINELLDIGDSFDSKLSERLASWSTEEIDAATTTDSADYLTQQEKQVYLYLNLARLYPRKFAATYLESYDGPKGYSKGYAFDERKQSLLTELYSRNPAQALQPDYEQFLGADCFATEMGQLGRTGHARSGTSCSKNFKGECCDYGNYSNGIYHVLELLIDSGENNAELGHRRICLDSKYTLLGAAIRSHKKYGKNAVLDFSYE